MWSALVLAAAALLLATELAAGCPPGGPLTFGESCGQPRALAIATLAVGAALYVAGLTGVTAWVSGLVRRGAADRRAARDWYLLAASVGLVAAPLLAFTVVSAFR